MNSGSGSASYCGSGSTIGTGLEKVSASFPFGSAKNCGRFTGAVIGDCASSSARSSAAIATVGVSS